MKCKLVLPHKELYFHALHEMRKYAHVNRLWYTYLWKERGRLVFEAKEAQHASYL